MSNKKAIALLRAEKRRTLKFFSRHIKVQHCETDSAGCLDRARYQERIASLNWALYQLGGLPKYTCENMTTIDELPI